MVTALCGISAFEFWRTPPLIRMLVNPSDSGRDLPLEPERLWELRKKTYHELEIWRNSSVLEAHGRPFMSNSALDVLDTIARIAPCVSAPIEILVPSPSDRRPSGLVRPHVMSLDFSKRELVRISPSLCVTSPALTLLTLAPRLSLARLVMAASELCGSFSVYETPHSLREVLEGLNRAHMVPRVSSWSPSFDESGHLADLWSRPPLVKPKRIAELADEARGRRGCRLLRHAAELVTEGAASPFEAQAAMLLGFPCKLGGEGYGGFTHNHEVTLSDAARRLAGRRTCRCDLYWPSAGGRRALDLECQSKLFHVGESRGLSDADRATALQSMGIEVLLATYAQFDDERRFDALSAAIAEKIGRTPPERTREYLEARAKLRDEVLVSWKGFHQELR